MNASTVEASTRESSTVKASTVEISIGRSARTELTSLQQYNFLLTPSLFYKNAVSVQTINFCTALDLQTRVAKRPRVLVGK